MGNDGGSIPDRTSQIRVRKRKRRINKLEIQKSKSNLCSMTKEKLRKPIVADRLGQLYNKTSIIEFLLNLTFSQIMLDNSKILSIEPQIVPKQITLSF